MEKRKNPPINRSRGLDIKQTGAETSQSTDGETITVDPNQLANDVVVGAVGAVVGTVATRLVLGEV